LVGAEERSDESDDGHLHLKSKIPSDPQTKEKGKEEKRK
jgi:hypothetical protein